MVALIHGFAADSVVGEVADRGDWLTRLKGDCPLFRRLHIWRRRIGIAGGVLRTAPW